MLSIGELSTRSEPTTERRKRRVEEKKLPQRMVRNAGGFYVCYRLSQMAWNAQPSMRYAKGPNVVIDSEDEMHTCSLKVRSLSKRDPIPLGKDPHIDADWVVVCTRARTDIPECYVMTPDEVSKLAHRDKHGDSYWLEPLQYDTEQFAERWNRIGYGLA
jgi:hypothetical protein